MRETQPSEPVANKRALLIGINEYPHLAERYQLHACVNDVDLIEHILQENFGFLKANIMSLRNGQATRARILAELDALTGRTTENDIIILYYSGHGSSIRDRENDEPDGFDETIVPYDGVRDRGAQNRDITDDEVYAWLLRLTRITPYITLIFDCCHSGSISRDPFGAASRWVEEDLRPIAELPPSPVVSDVTNELRHVPTGPSGWLPLGARYVLIAGCRDHESSYEYSVRQDGKEVMYGALTYFLSQELVKSGPGVTYRDVFEPASFNVTREKPRQHPLMEGAGDRELFGVRDVEPMRFIRVNSRIGDQCVLGAGAAHGLTVGSQWALYPQATKHVDERTPKLGRVEITAIRAVSSDAKLIEASKPDVIAAGARAVEEAHSYGEMRMVVDILAPTGYEAAAQALAAEIDKSHLVRRASPSEPADARAYIIPPRDGVPTGGAAPQLMCVVEPIWAIVGRQDGMLMMPTHRIWEHDVTSIVRNNLEKLVRYQQALGLQNANDASPLKNKVEFVIKRQKIDGSWIIAEPEEAGGKIVFDEGDRIALMITNRHSLSIYVSVLDFGLTGKISQLHPIPGAKEQLEIGRSIEVGVREGDELTLYMPDNFPYAPDPGDKAPTDGQETWKLIATVHEVDFSYLLQEGVRSADARRARGSDMQAMQLLTTAITGIGVRVRQLLNLPPNEDWTTIERSFILRRKVH